MVVSHAEAGPGDRAAGLAAAAAGLDLGPWIRWTRQTVRGKALDAEDADASYHSQTFAAFARDPATGRVVIGRVVEKTFDHETLRRRRRRRRRRRTTEEEGGGGVAAAAAAAREASRSESASSAPSAAERVEPSSASGEDSGDDQKRAGTSRAAAPPGGGPPPVVRAEAGGRAEWSYDASAETVAWPSGWDVLELRGGRRERRRAPRHERVGEHECAWALHLRSGLEMRFRFLRSRADPRQTRARRAPRGGAGPTAPAGTPRFPRRGILRARARASRPRRAEARVGPRSRRGPGTWRARWRRRLGTRGASNAPRPRTRRTDRGRARGRGRGGLADEEDAAARRSPGVWVRPQPPPPGPWRAPPRAVGARPDGCDLRHAPQRDAAPAPRRAARGGSVTTAYGDADSSKSMRAPCSSRILVGASETARGARARRWAAASPRQTVPRPPSGASRARPLRRSARRARTPGTHRVAPATSARCREGPEGGARAQRASGGRRGEPQPRRRESSDAASGRSGRRRSGRAGAKPLARSAGARQRRRRASAAEMDKARAAASVAESRRWSKEDERVRAPGARRRGPIPSAATPRGGGARAPEVSVSASLRGCACSAFCARSSWRRRRCPRLRASLAAGDAGVGRARRGHDAYAGDRRRSPRRGVAADVLARGAGPDPRLSDRRRLEKARNRRDGEEGTV